MKTNVISMISVPIRSVFIPNRKRSQIFQFKSRRPRLAGFPCAAVYLGRRRRPRCAGTAGICCASQLTTARTSQTCSPPTSERSGASPTCSRGSRAPSPAPRRHAAGVARAHAAAAHDEGDELKLQRSISASGSPSPHTDSRLRPLPLRRRLGLRPRLTARPLRLRPRVLSRSRGTTLPASVRACCRFRFPSSRPRLPFRARSVWPPHPRPFVPDHCCSLC